MPSSHLYIHTKANCQFVNMLVNKVTTEYCMLYNFHELDILFFSVITPAKFTTTLPNMSMSKHLTYIHFNQCTILTTLISSTPFLLINFVYKPFYLPSSLPTTILSIPCHQYYNRQSCILAFHCYFS